MFDHEKLDVYQLELKFLTWVTQFLADISPVANANARAQGSTGSRESLGASKPNPEIRNRACARARNRENSRSAATLAGTEELRKDRALFSARIANRSRMSTSRSTSTIPQTSEFRLNPLG
jgi:hypothetical protein